MVTTISVYERLLLGTLNNFFRPVESKKMSYFVLGPLSRLAAALGQLACLAAALGSLDWLT